MNIITIFIRCLNGIRPIAEKIVGKHFSDRLFNYVLLRLHMRACSPGRRNLKSGGISLVMDLRSISSLSQICREFAYKLADVSIPFDIYDSHVSRANEAGGMLREEEVVPLLRYVGKKSRYHALLKFSGSGSLLPDVPGYENAHALFWEYDTGAKEVFQPMLKKSRHVVVFSDFCRDVYAKSLPSYYKVHKIRYPLSLKRRYPEKDGRNRLRWKIPEDAFMVMFHFGLGPTSGRKNPEAVIKAFTNAFADCEDAVLVLKTTLFSIFPQSVERIRKAALESGCGDRIILLNENMAYWELLKLIAASDVYISLHHGEGFGMGMLEAMCCGTPVIATDYSGNVEFTKPETAFMVPVKMVPLPDEERHGTASFVTRWADPDVDVAARHLRSIYEDRSLGHAKAVAAKEYIKEYFSDANFRSDVENCIREMSCG